MIVCALYSVSFALLLVAFNLLLFCVFVLCCIFFKIRIQTAQLLQISQWNTFFLFKCQLKCMVHTRLCVHVCAGMGVYVHVSVNVCSDVERQRLQYSVC